MQLKAVLALLVVWKASKAFKTVLTRENNLQDISNGETFDYIVVGAGAAGSAVAARLTLAGASVLLVEAGGDPSGLTKIPGLAPIFTGSSIDWNYGTVSNNISCLAAKRRACRFTRGRVLGGSTTINYMMYTRGNPRDYNFNITGWTWQDIEPYFLKYEGLQDLDLLPPSSSPHHNTSGPVAMGYFTDSGNPWHPRIIEAHKLLNFPYNPDVNGKSQIGVSKIFGYTSGGQRVSMATAYLNRPDVKNKLKILKYTRCTGVIIDEDNVAKGVSVARGNINRKMWFYASKEVILSAGAIGTPQILMLSGIGPSAHLKSLGISIRADIPVGENMSDHAFPLLVILGNRDRTPTSKANFLALNSLKAVQWLISRTGALASIGLTDVTAFVNTNCYDFAERKLINNRPECELPTMQFIYGYTEKKTAKYAKQVFMRSLNYVDKMLDQFTAANDEHDMIVVSAVVLQPKSYGWVRLESADPLADPKIYPNYLSDERDLDEMVRGLRIVEDMVGCPVYRAQNASVLRPRIPGCPRSSAGYWRCYARQFTHSAQHAVGTAAAGRVLDARLRVRGVARLRVADASALPHLPRGNTAAAVIAMGERLADFLLEDKQFI